MQEKGYKTIGFNYISVCCVCFPGRTVLKSYPELDSHVQISHGMCKRHFDEYMALIGKKPLDSQPLGG